MLSFDHPDLAVSFSGAGHNSTIFPITNPVRKRTEKHVSRLKRKVI